MNETLFETAGGQQVTAVTAEEMRAVDRVAVEDVGLTLRQMMENAGRNLAAHAREMQQGNQVVVLAGDGGNGGGGLSCARHLANRDVPVSVVLDRTPAKLSGAAAQQYEILTAMDVPVGTGPDAVPTQPGLVVDALVGYGLSGALGGFAAELVTETAEADLIMSLDVPTGRNATTGAEPGVAVTSDRVLTLALPKTGLADGDWDLWLADIAIPATVYDRLDIPYENPFGEYWVELTQRD
ncbi:NAD(P)H-hydrate epimerase [Halovenus rubra]|uniref:NAD(P)H-hydrate epimerase n=2 Tax=Halovenus rubra TaxID=869890 RepID=A0ACC7E3V6_9EURY